MYTPSRILFEKEAMKFDTAKSIYEHFSKEKNTELIELRGNKIKENIPGDNLYDFYRAGKKTLVVGVKKGMNFQSCKPSAHYQLPLVSGCIGGCQYCYLNTNLGDKPYLRINVNTGDIFMQAQAYIRERLPHTTIFEGSATSDPVPVEPYSHVLGEAIEYFGKNENGRFRFVTKFTDIDTLLSLDHRDHTEIRFTLNTGRVIKDYEKGTPSPNLRLAACRKILEAGYPFGFIIAPVFLYENWQEEYHDLLVQIRESLPAKISHPVTFEIISHRYTTRAKNIINEVFPDNSLPMEEKERTFKYGQFGYGKYVYPKDRLAYMADYFAQEIDALFDNKSLLYII